MTHSSHLVDAEILLQFSYLIDAKNDMDRIKDSLKEIHAKLDDLVDVVEYETLAEKVR